MNVRDLLDVRIICEVGSLRQAAALLGVTQPTLGNRIAHLEDQLGAALFDRSRGRTRPTALARFIALRADRLHDESQRLMREVRRAATGKAGHVRVGIGQIVMQLMLADLLEPLEAVHSDLNLELLSAPTAQLATALRAGELDLLVSSITGMPSDVLESEMLCDTPVVAVAHPDHPLQTRPPRDIRGLFEYPFAVNALESVYRDHLRTNGIDLDRVERQLVCSDFQLLVRAVARQPLYFTGGPRELFASAIAAGRLAVIAVDVPFRHQVYLHRRRDAYPLPATQQVEATIRRSFAALRARAAGGWSTTGVDRSSTGSPVV